MQAECNKALAEIVSLQKARVIQLEETCYTKTIRAGALSTERDRCLERLQELETALDNAPARYHDAKQTNKQFKRTSIHR